MQHPIMLDIEFAEASDCGPVRPHNEDFVGHSLPSNPEHARSRGWVFVLADGVGGQDRGEVASRLAVETVLAECATPLRERIPRRCLTRCDSERANTACTRPDTAPSPPPWWPVRCALTARPIAHVGDSRCYLIRARTATAADAGPHGAQRAGSPGLFPAAEAQRARLRSILTRSIGINLFVAPEISEHHVIPGDLLLLCSDGLHGAVSDEKIVAHRDIGAGSLDDAAQQLIAIANQSDGGDNVSVQLIRVKNVEAVGMYRGRPYRLH